MSLSFKSVSHVCAIIFQSLNDMSSEAFINGVSIFVMLQICEISGASFKISSSSVQVVPPVFGSSLAEIVPPVMIRAIFGSFSFCSNSIFSFFSGMDFCRTLTERISFSLIPMLYPESNLRRMTSGS